LNKLYIAIIPMIALIVLIGCTQSNSTGGALKGLPPAAEGGGVPVNEPPTVYTGGPYNGITNQVVYLNGSAIDADGTIKSIWWASLSSDCNITQEDINGLNTKTATDKGSLVCTQTGIKTVKLTATDNKNASSSATTTVTISETPNRKPAAFPGGPYVGYINTFIPIYGMGQDFDGTIASITWSLDSNASDCNISDQNITGIGTNIATNNAKIKCLISGYKYLKLTVTDNKGASDANTTTVEVGTSH